MDSTVGDAALGAIVCGVEPVLFAALVMGLGTAPGSSVGVGAAVMFQGTAIALLETARRKTHHHK